MIRQKLFTFFFVRNHSLSNCFKRSRILFNYSTMASSVGFKYPNARRDESICEEHFGKKVKSKKILNGVYFFISFFQIPDPYRYLENPNDKETIKFIDQQNDITEPYLKDEGGAVWKNINEKLTKFWNYEKYTCASKRGSRYFYSHNRYDINYSELLICSRHVDNLIIYLNLI